MIKNIVKLVLSWRLATIVIAAIAYFLLPSRDCCTDTGFSLSYLSKIWANFAGGDILDLAAVGYGYPLKLGTYIFFPFFPGLIRFVSQFTPDYLSSGLFISHLSLVLALYYLYRLIKLDYNGKIAWQTIILLIIFPTSLFFGSVYTESFFLLLVVLSFYFIRKDKIFLACLMAMFASATRVAGIFIFPAILIEVWQSRRFSPSLVWLSLPPLGLLSYMRLLLVKTGDPLFFLKVSPDFGPNLVVSKLILIHQVFYRYGRMLFLTKSPDITFVVILLELFLGVLFLVLSYYAFQKLRLSYAVYALLSFLVPTLTGSFSGITRYGLTIFPAFILLSIWFTKQKKQVQNLYYAACVILGAICVALFTRGYFIG